MAPKTQKTQNLPKVPPLKIENAQLIYKNLSGMQTPFNAKGQRNFHVILDVEQAKSLQADGWNVRWHEPKEEGDPLWATLKVAVRFDNYPPRIVLVTKKSKASLNESSVDLLDSAEIALVDMIISGSRWEVNKEKGIKAYLSKMFVTLSETDLEAKYFGDLMQSSVDDD